MTFLDETAELKHKVTEMLDELKNILVESHQNELDINALEKEFEQLAVTGSSTSEEQNQMKTICEIKGDLMKLKSEAHDKDVEINELKEKLKTVETTSITGSFEDVKKFWENIK